MCRRMPSPEDVLAALVRVGFEEEDVHRFELQGPIVVGEVLEFVEEPQSNGKTIRWCQVRVAPDGEPAADGGPAVHGVVCGARNFFAGDKVVVTLPGLGAARPVPDRGAQDLRPRLRRHDRLGEGARPRRRAQRHPAPGRARHRRARRHRRDRAARPRRRRGRHQRHARPRLRAVDPRRRARVLARDRRGVPRPRRRGAWDELAAPAPASPIAVDDASPIRGRVGASEFVARIVRDVDPTKPTPAVDGRAPDARRHPLARHPDRHHQLRDARARPADPRLRPRQARRAASRCAARRAGEKLETLDGKVRTLDAEDLLITDESGPIGLAGVMGGGTTEMSDATRNVLIEAATFDPVTIARTARRHKLPVRGVPPLRARRRPARSRSSPHGASPTSWSSTPAAPSTASWAARCSPSVESPASTLPARLRRGPHRRRLHARARSSRALEMIGCEVHERAEALVGAPAVVAPRPHRQVDARRRGRPHRGLRPHPVGAADCRRRAAGSPPRSRVAVASRTRSPPPASSRRRRSPFTTEEQNDLHGSASGGHLPSVKLANPLDGQAPFLRRSLIPGLLEIAHRNVSRGFTDLALFEIGRRLPARARRRVRHRVRPAARGATGCRDPRRAGRVDPAAAPPCRGAADRQPSSPKQPGAAAVAAGPRRRARRGPHDRGGRGRRRSTSRRASARRCTPAAPACCRCGATEVGYVGELLPAVAEAADLPGRVIVAELDLDLVLSLAGEKVVAASLSGFPAATQDVSLVRRRRRARRRGARGARRGCRRAARVAAARGRLPRRRVCPRARRA